MDIESKPAVLKLLYFLYKYTNMIKGQTTWFLVKNLVFFPVIDK